MMIMDDNFTNIVKDLNVSNVSVDADVHLKDVSVIQNAYQGSSAAVVIVPKDVVNTYGINVFANQTLAKLNNKYNSVIVATDSGQYAAAGNDAEQIATTLNSNNAGDVQKTLVDNSSNVKELATSKKQNTTTTSTQHDSSSPIVPIVGGFGSVAIAGAVVYTLIKHSHKSKKSDFFSDVVSDKVRFDVISPDNVVDDSNEAKNLRSAMNAWYDKAGRVGSIKLFGLSDLHSKATDILDRWDELKNNNSAQFQVRKIILEEVPFTLNLYYDLPDDIRVLRNKDTGLTPTETVKEQISLMTDALGDVRSALFEGYIKELDVQSIFLKSKYQKNNDFLLNDK